MADFGETYESSVSDGVWMKQVARWLTDAIDGICLGKKHLIIDRDSKYLDAFMQMLRHCGIEPALCPVRAPKCDVFAERFVRPIKQECLDTLIPLAERYLEPAIQQSVEHHNVERNHQGIGNRLINGAIRSREGTFILQNAWEACSITTIAKPLETSGLFISAEYFGSTGDCVYRAGFQLSICRHQIRLPLRIGCRRQPESTFSATYSSKSISADRDPIPNSPPTRSDKRGRSGGVEKANF